MRRLLLAFLTDALIVTLAAQVLTLPLVAYYFGRVSVVSPLANSLVLRLGYGETSVLLTGDVPAEVQKQLVESGVGLESSVVKLPDGGRQASFSEAFLMATRPTHAVAFVQAEDRFRDLSAAVEETWMEVVGEEGFHRTDLAGTVSLASDGRTLTLAN